MSDSVIPLVFCRINALFVVRYQSRRQKSRLKGAKRLLGGGGEAKCEIKHRSRCFQKQKLVNWGGQACRLGGQAPPGLALAPALLNTNLDTFVV